MDEPVPGRLAHCKSPSCSVGCQQFIGVVLTSLKISDLLVKCQDCQCTANSHLSRPEGEVQAVCIFNDHYSFYSLHPSSQSLVLIRHN